MNFFTNKKIWQKILIIMLLVLLFQFALPRVSNASVTSVILEPITELLANLGDGIMEIMQKTFLGMESSGAWIESSSNLWSNILIAVVAIAAVVIAVAATIASGGLALTVIIAATGAVIKIGAGAAIAFFAVNTLHLGESGFYLPEYQLTPQAIFQNDIVAFDVNFFNPKKNLEVKKEVSAITLRDYTESVFMIIYNKDGTPYLKDPIHRGSGEVVYNNGNGEVDGYGVKYVEGGWTESRSNYGYHYNPDNEVRDEIKKNLGKENYDRKVNLSTQVVDGKVVSEENIENTYVKDKEGNYVGRYGTKESYRYYIRRLLY